MKAEEEDEVEEEAAMRESRHLNSRSLVNDVRFMLAAQ